MLLVMRWVESGLLSVGKVSSADLNKMGLTELNLAKKQLQRVMGMRGVDNQFYARELAKVQNKINSLCIAKFNQALKEKRESRRPYYPAKRTDYEVLEVAANLKYLF
jgi:hypothetical protein